MKKIIALLSILLLSACSANNGQNSETINPISGNVLVAYFSVTNHTRTLANYAKEHL